MTWTTADVTRLQAAIASGQLSVRLGERQVTYQSVDAMLTALDRMKADMAAAASPRRAATARFHFTTLRGD
ncbi:phage head-tail joining protein [Stenotrophomonas sp. LARHCG68]